MVSIVANGKPGTAMMSFSSLLSEGEIEAVVHFVRSEFMQNKAKNARYHSIENGWENHDQYSDAFPFATGEINLDQSWESLTESQRRGKQLFLTSCISCHDRAKVINEGVIWESYPLSWPRNGIGPNNINDVDAISEATPYSKHDQREVIVMQTLSQRRGEALFVKNCTFCHAEDGSGKNWVGQFIQPHPRNFQRASIQTEFSKSELVERISNGVNGSAMPAWRYVLSEQDINDIVDYIWERFK